MQIYELINILASQGHEHCYLLGVLPRTTQCISTDFQDFLNSTGLPDISILDQDNEKNI